MPGRDPPQPNPGRRTGRRTRSRPARRPAGRSRRWRAGGGADAAEAPGWRPGSSRSPRAPSRPPRWGPRSARRLSASPLSLGGTTVAGSGALLSDSIEAAGQGHDRERQPVEVVVDVVVQREARARVLRLIPAAVGALGCSEPRHAARERRPLLWPAARADRREEAIG